MMKKCFLLCLCVILCGSVFAQGKIAVLDFKAGVGVSQNDVDGLSATFLTYFYPVGYTLVERTQVNRVLDEQNFQRTSLTESEMVRLGKILNLTKIVVGDVNIVAGKPNLDIRVVDVQSGMVTGRDGATFSWSDFRTTIKSLAERIAGQIRIVTGTTASTAAPSSSTPANSGTGKTSTGKVETILGYLHVYPEDIGFFNSKPSNVIEAVNNQALHGYNDWKLPTSEELSLMRSMGQNLGLKDDPYMTEESTSGGRLVRLVSVGKTVAEKEAKCPSKMTDVDGNTYNTVQIGNQCWMKENLRTTKYADNTTIPMGSTLSYNVAYRYCPDGDASNVPTYGYLYNWPAVMRNSSSSSANPSGVQGICPTGWHVPSNAEWTQLTDYVSSQSQYMCSSNRYNAKALASTTGWESSPGTSTVGNNPSTNNATGFSAVPAGYYYGSYRVFGEDAYFWSATLTDASGAYYRHLYYYAADVGSHNLSKNFGFSVRCLRD